MPEKNLNADWKQWYKDHLITMDEAIKMVKPGDIFYLGQATTVPYAFLDALYAHKEDYHDVGFWYNVMNYPANMLFDHDTKEHFRLMNIFNLPLDRMGIDDHIIEVLGSGYDFYTSCMWENGVNAYAHTFCPPDEEGYCNVGAYGVTTASTALNDKEGHIKKRFAFVDATGVYASPGPRDTHYVHVTEFDYIVECDTEMMALDNPLPTDKDKDIASFILPYIKDGDNVQIGYGGLGNYILGELGNMEGTFNVFTEVLCDTMVPLVESGKIKKLRASSPSACSEETFKWLATTKHDVGLYPRTYAIETLSTMMQENVVSVNATFMVDLIGQCCSEAQGTTPYTGQGGSLAYTYGTIRTPGGRSFIALRSTYTDKSGTLQSNIVPWLPEGSIVTTLKNHVMFVVSEHGLADVYLKTYQDRIKALIRIADPQFREWLKEKILTTKLIEEWDFKDYDIMDSTPPPVRQPHNMLPYEITMQYNGPLKEL